MGKTRGKLTLLPHMYVIKGDHKDMVGLGEATLLEYISAMSRMVIEPTTPNTWRRLPTSNNVLTVGLGYMRRWSERVFSMIDDGRFPYYMQLKTSSEML